MVRVYEKVIKFPNSIINACTVVATCRTSDAGFRGYNDNQYHYTRLPGWHFPALPRGEIMSSLSTHMQLDEIIMKDDRFIGRGSEVTLGNGRLFTLFF